jgi:hypothetical protein
MAHPLFDPVEGQEQGRIGTNLIEEDAHQRSRSGFVENDPERT